LDYFHTLLLSLRWEAFALHEHVDVQVDHWYSSSSCRASFTAVIWIYNAVGERNILCVPLSYAAELFAHYVGKFPSRMIDGNLLVNTYMEMSAGRSYSIPQPLISMHVIVCTMQFAAIVFRMGHPAML